MHQKVFKEQVLTVVLDCGKDLHCCGLQSVTRQVNKICVYVWHPKPCAICSPNKNETYVVYQKAIYL
jgi:hypothetical protein